MLYEKVQLHLFTRRYINHGPADVHFVREGILHSINMYMDAQMRRREVIIHLFYEKFE